MPQVEVLIGMIASGKSTYTARRAQEGAIIVNDDAIVTLVHGGDYTLYSKDLKPLYKSIESHIIIQSLMLGRDVVVDRPNYRLSTRQRYIALAKMLDLPAFGICFEKNSPHVHAERRFRSDPRGHTLQYWMMVAQAHADQWQDISQDEGFTGFRNMVWKE